MNSDSNTNNNQASPTSNQSTTIPPNTNRSIENHQYDKEIIKPKEVLEVPIDQQLSFIQNLDVKVVDVENESDSNHIDNNLLSKNISVNKNSNTAIGLDKANNR